MEKTKTVSKKKKLSSPRLIHCRLINSDEIIGELSGSSDDELFILKPMLVSEVTDTKTHISTIVLSKYILFEDNKAVPFKKAHVITQTDILDEIKKYYYNSLAYNSRFVEPVIRAELAKVNYVMENILRQSIVMDDMIQTAVLETQDDKLKGKNIFPLANTVN